MGSKQQQRTIDVKTELRATPPLARRREPGMHRPAPVPGRYLRTAVDSVLAELSATAVPDVQAMHRCDDTLRCALAWTAAVGDTCRVAAAVDAVRDARLRLDAADPDQARLALLTARDGLRLPMPGPRAASH
ncbi:hypothetical protein [Actinophytocola sp.]|uniref:hypothetical protein n=1 Tax=Actinophytocola sp. TaxID=1872138 RepID=UPI002D80EA5F|nr:hypothetical protein [Actinophytocola sp.]HET9138051.1 hypothetical protein [Actinophytocola sp.]HEU5107765.1 hypothetical protein [Micromonosporaceae bacterium]